MTGGVLYMCTIATVVCYKLTCAAVVGCPEFFKPLLTLSTPLYLVVCFISVLLVLHQPLMEVVCIFSCHFIDENISTDA